MVFSTAWEIINAVAARTQLFHYSLICSEPMHTPYGDIPDRLARDMRGRYHADGTGPAEATDDRTGRELAELPPGPGARSFNIRQLTDVLRCNLQHDF